MKKEHQKGFVRVKDREKMVAMQSSFYLSEDEKNEFENVWFDQSDLNPISAISMIMEN